MHLIDFYTELTLGSVCYSVMSVVHKCGKCLLLVDILVISQY